MGNSGGTGMAVREISVLATTMPAMMSNNSEYPTTVRMRNWRNCRLKVVSLLFMYCIIAF